MARVGDDVAEDFVTLVNKISSGFLPQREELDDTEPLDI